ncbi:MAG: glycine--tRNA ligase subunit beta, partial [Acidimicrobiales bacterium]|nr:glycine--tRNA ligase subunit beta [Acidimicrobiales bacterium]
VYVEPSIRPDDSRYGDNPNRLQCHTQLQVILKPDPGNPTELYLESLTKIGIDRSLDDIRFVEDNWESPALGAWGLGWEVWLNGLEITQFTYFQQAGGVQLDPVAVEITYGIERIMMALQGVRRFQDIEYAPGVSYGEIASQAEYEMSKYYLDTADVGLQRKWLSEYEKCARHLIDQGLPLPAYQFVLRCSHAFNILDARGAVGTVERAKVFKMIRGLAHEVACLYIRRREELGFPLGVRQPSQVTSETDIPPVDSSITSAPLLVELGFEELPVDTIPSYGERLDLQIRELLTSERIEANGFRVYSTPRRVALLVDSVSTSQPAESTIVRGPRLEISFDASGAPTPAAAGFAAKMGVAVEELSVVEHNGDQFLAVAREREARSTAAVLAERLPAVIRAVTAGRGMRWGAGPGFAASRPLRWLTVLLGSQAIPVCYAGLVSGRATRALRQDDSEISVPDAASYVSLLERHGVIADEMDRRAMVRDSAAQLAASVGGVAAIDPEDPLLIEVARLVEYPAPLLGSFDEQFLDLPVEVLVTVMGKQQRFFPVYGPAGQLLPYFIGVANGNVDTERVRLGYEAVLRARFSDALFFFERDREHPLDWHRERLASILFEERSGSMLDRARRIETIACDLADLLGVDQHTKTIVARAAHLAKADLATQLVAEFSSLEGTIGYHYALSAGEDPAVARAILDASRPRHARDSGPETLSGAIISLADRADLLVSLFSVGAHASGSSDPFGLRRAASGLLQLLEEHFPTLRLSQLLERAAAVAGCSDAPSVVVQVREFIRARGEVRLSEAGKDAPLIAAFADRWDEPTSIGKAIQEFEDLAKTPRLARIVETIRRVQRLVGETQGPGQVRPELFTEPAEEMLWNAIGAFEQQLGETPSASSFCDAFIGVVPAVERFFEDVLVMSDDLEIRANRLQLLSRISAPAAQIARWHEIEAWLNSRPSPAAPAS